MVNIVSVAGFCITAVLLCKITEKSNKEQAVILGIAGTTAVMFFIITAISPVLQKINTIFETGGIDSENVAILFRSLGISYISQTAGNICRDCGENSIALSAETAGKVLILITAMPLIDEILKVIMELFRNI